jgi:hypothetical protein
MRFLQSLNLQDLAFKPKYRVTQNKCHMLQTKSAWSPMAKISNNGGDQEKFSFEACWFFAPSCSLVKNQRKTFKEQLSEFFLSLFRWRKI